jgi:hypothetical protein
MNRAALALSIAGSLTTTLGAFGCSSSSSPAATDGGAIDGTTEGGAPDAPASQSLCQNASDIAASQRFYCPGNAGIDDVASQCGVSCAFNLDAGACATSCIVAATGGALSTACASCYGVMVVCARDNCLNECLADPLGNICLRCRCGNNLPKHVNCYVATEACSGDHRTECEQLEAGTWKGYPTGDAGCVDEGGSEQ